MRISSSQLYSLNVSMMNDQQAQIAQLYQQVASGVSLTTPADNPLAAAQAVQLTATSATLAQYTSNQSTVLTSLQTESSTLTSVSDALNAAYQTIMHAGDGGLSDSDRAALAAQLQGSRDHLLTLANTTDGAGNYVFAGFQPTTAPFANKAGGGVNYSGDYGSRVVQIADTNTVSQGDNGASVFLSVPFLGSLPVPAAAASNTGTGTVGAVSITNPSDPTNAHQFTITFGGTAAAPTYTVTDNTVQPPTTSAAQPYSSGQGINLGGQTVAVSGTPAAGDQFTVTPAPQSGADVFATLDTAIAALKAPVGNSPTASTALSNAMATASTKLMNTLTNVLTVQASVGGRMQEVKAIQSVTSTNSLQAANSLSNLTDTNLPAAISQFLQLQNSLSAAQKAFVQMQNLSLFQYLNP
ncbi:MULTISPECIES: flagellar hook-associated protein FlgL [Burkholderia]|uniref:flagellar hook-associated protein FlgL n=1 Tax=Burkholderia TaxID=32008 RepID=UPI0007587294|nr:MULTISPECIES: flagellar hook-associated protein FlgL [Burkholderia]AOJ70305.1 flagellar biosynthesis protein FlgL [Burkholderia savannae]KVG38768.1 flagellar biosynthesis protein FlgL [Burkholderia sp. MSMB0265]KVG82087.1 flagellar biosynthesis protein FlgL [Burkholderia sp. MSMB2040]KVG91380.1 flagellar biosynthesis protein FlgL [Burkholderia sp. MSMB2041]KVG98251.1 flagellar biosynthesis protein FlgL [Burkholderia sp. MSMB2042]